MKKVFFFAFGILLLSCNKPIVLIPACTTFTDSVVELSLGYLYLCEKSAEGSTQQMKVEISVDGLIIEGTNAAIQYMQMYSFNVDNSSNGGPNEDRVFKIKLPACGTYIVDVVIRGKDDSCFNCCSGTSTFSPNCGSSNPSKGTPRFRGTSLTINASDEAPPPNLVKVSPVKQGCTGCGC
jgi:hypothetical protein